VSLGLGNSVAVIDTQTLTVRKTIAGFFIPHAMAVVGSNLFVAEYSAARLSVIDMETDTVTGTVNVGFGPNGVTVSPDGSKIYVANYSGLSVSVVDVETLTVERTIHYNSPPAATEVTPDGSKLYVALPGLGRVSVIEAGSGTEIASIAVGNGPFVIGISADGSRAFTVNYSSSSMSVIDTATNTVTDTLDLSSGPYMIGTFMVPVAVAKAKTGSLAAPVLVSAVPGNASVTLEWNAVDGATGYNVYQSVTFATYGDIAATVTGSVYTTNLTGLINGTTYYFSVKAVKDGKESDYSNQLSAMPEVPPPEPDPDPVTTDEPQQPASGPGPITSLAEPTDEPEPIDEPKPQKSDVYRSDVIKADANVVQNIAAKVEQFMHSPTSYMPNDISGHWAEKPIQTFVKLGIVAGYEDGTFKPDADMTRAEFASIIMRVFGITGGSKNPALKDIEGHWAKDAIENLTAAGVLSGYGDGTFRPDKKITREEMVVILSRIVNLNAVEKDASKGSFADLAGSYAANRIKDAAQAGIVSGKPGSVFEPRSNVTRAEALTAILNALNLNEQVKLLLSEVN
jgi:YVTN family beta-propeller protein